jgi:hypothetical protein
MLYSTSSAKRLMVAMSISLFIVSLQGCASGNWANYSYGPGDWLSDAGFGDWNTMHNYQKIVSPEIRLHYVENPAELCGSFHARGCARLTAGYCDIWIHKNHKRATLDHEIRHCHGWDHFRVDHTAWSSRSSEQRYRAESRASYWFPTDKSSSVSAKGLQGQATLI